MFVEKPPCKLLWLQVNTHHFWHLCNNGIMHAGTPQKLLRNYQWNEIHIWLCIRGTCMKNYGPGGHIVQQTWILLAKTKSHDLWGVYLRCPLSTVGDWQLVPACYWQACVDRYSVPVDSETQQHQRLQTKSAVKKEVRTHQPSLFMWAVRYVSCRRDYKLNYTIKNKIPQSFTFTCSH